MAKPASDQRHDDARIMTTAVGRVADALSLTNAELAAVIGGSAPTASRLRRGQAVLPRHSKSFELAGHLVRLYRSLVALTGGENAVTAAWLDSENHALRGRPRDLIQTVDGLLRTLAYVDSRRAPL